MGKVEGASEDNDDDDDDDDAPIPEPAAAEEEDEEEREGEGGRLYSSTPVSHNTIVAELRGNGTAHVPAIALNSSGLENTSLVLILRPAGAVRSGAGVTAHQVLVHESNTRIRASHRPATAFGLLRSGGGIKIGMEVWGKSLSFSSRDRAGE
jgi:hypothetical protein